MGALRRIWSFRYLVVDDSFSQRKLIADTLKAFGAKSVRDTAAGASALEMSTQFTPDIIVLDWFLPDMTGDQVIRTLTSMDLVPRPTVIVMTSMPTVSIVTTARDLGAVTVIRKPFLPDVLLRTLVRVAESVASVDIAMHHKSDLPA